MSSIQTGIELNDQFTGVIYSIINAVNIAVSTMEDMQQTMNSEVDAGAFEGMRNELSDATLAVDELAAALADLGQSQQVINTDPFVNAPVSETVEARSVSIQSRAPPDTVEIPLIWNTDGLEVFTGSGYERFQQEVQSANDMLEQLCSTQDSIAKQAYNSRLFPPEAFQDLNRLAVRIDMVRDRIWEIEENPMNFGTDVANEELEQLRSQLNLAVQEQNELNQAMQDMDVSAANDAYLRLSQTVGNTEQYIRDNTDEQGRFNQQISEGVSQADDLMDTIKDAIAAYVSLQSIGKALELSDELTQVTARLDMMNDMLQMTDELTNMVYAAAEDSRGSFFEMADVVARFGNNARDAFDSSAEVVAFANLIQKQMTLAGASTEEASNAMLQLSQGLGSGVLRGDELNSIFEQAPNLIQNIADYLGVGTGEIREMASEGVLTADTVKAAIFGAADEINAKFEEMPMTWGQILQSMQNTAFMAFRPVLQRLNDIANSEALQNFVSGAIEAMATLANIVLNIFELVGTVGSFIADNWSIISPIIYGVVAALAVYAAYLGIVKGIEIATAAATAIMTGAKLLGAAAMVLFSGATWASATAQMGLNSAMYACPIVWITILIIALIAIVFVLCNAFVKLTGITDSGFGLICGIVATAVSFIANIVIGLINIIIDLVIDFYNLLANFAAAFGILFNDPVAAIKATVLSLFNFIVGIVMEAASLLDAVFGSNLADTVSAFQNKIQAEIDATIENAGGSTAQTLNPSDYKFERINYGEAFNAGTSWGDGVADAVSNFSLSDIFGKTDIPNTEDYTSQFAGMSDSLDGISGDTGNISDAMDITQEDLKYLRDIAEQEAVNRYTVAEVSVDMSGMQNTVNNGTDLDGFMSGLTDAVNEAVDSITEGVHE